MSVVRARDVGGGGGGKRGAIVCRGIQGMRGGSGRGWGSVTHTWPVVHRWDFFCLGQEQWTGRGYWSKVLAGWGVWGAHGTSRLKLSSCIQRVKIAPWIDKIAKKNADLRREKKKCGITRSRAGRLQAYCSLCQALGLGVLSAQMCHWVGGMGHTIWNICPILTDAL